MSLARAGRTLVCACSSCSQHTIKRCLSLSWPVANNKRLTNVQQGFEGLHGGFLWDDQHGFGYNKDGELVIVSKNFNSKVSTSVPDEEFPESQTESLLNVAKECYKVVNRRQNK